MPYEFRSNPYPISSPLGEAFQRREEALAEGYPIGQRIATIRMQLREKEQEHTRSSLQQTQTYEMRERREQLRAEMAELNKQREAADKDARRQMKSMPRLTSNISYCSKPGSEIHRSA